MRSSPKPDGITSSVLLDLEAVWCHWCNVMDANTYSDPQVINLLRAHYITLKVDQDSRPDLSNRYEDFGWPATVVFEGEGHEIVKRQGYLSPDEMASMQVASRIALPFKAVRPDTVRGSATQLGNRHGPRIAATL